MLFLRVKQQAVQMTRTRRPGWRIRDGKTVKTVRNLPQDHDPRCPSAPTRPDPHHPEPGAESAAHPSSLAENPTCSACSSDEFIYLESFKPPSYAPDGSVAALGEVAYTCTRCETFAAHAVPASWSPPGWYLG
ncbi:hypothetical protein PSET11_00565 [Arthrobacter ulcerisalmonis]|uniref:Uncharacterized protein n=1 Tax=Arthrobacter ulcerisalmonis TaxID=2483813 RepID=A0A3P5WXU9_9MICC|nr:hypothetical protein PSET11_00565 [Arthrobacter ulcerisalmonis]